MVTRLCDGIMEYLIFVLSKSNCALLSYVMLIIAQYFCEAAQFT